MARFRKRCRSAAAFPAPVRVPGRAPTPPKPFRVGDRVRIRKHKTWIAWGKRTPQEYGFITAIDGSYILVRPRWQKYPIEFYPNEIDPAGR